MWTRIKLGTSVALVGSSLALGCSGSEADGPGGGSGDPSAKGAGAPTAPAPTGNTPAAPTTSPTTPPPPQVGKGSFTFATYNVAGLNDLVSKVTPSQAAPLISPKLNAFQIAVLQEDFEHHAAVVGQAQHPHKTTPKKPSGRVYADGLNALSSFPMSKPKREMWARCNGLVDAKNDCLAEKGFMHVIVTVTPGVEVDVYTLHNDAGGSAGDIGAREAQVDQLIKYLGAHSAGRPVVVAGDTNMGDDDEMTFARLLRQAKLRDACRELSCPEPMAIDRVLLRDGSKVSLTVAGWKRESFQNAKGDDLSDHDPISVKVSYEAR